MLWDGGNATPKRCLGCRATGARESLLTDVFFQVHVVSICLDCTLDPARRRRVQLLSALATEGPFAGEPSPEAVRHPDASDATSAAWSHLL